MLRVGGRSFSWIIPLYKEGTVMLTGFTKDGNLGMKTTEQIINDNEDLFITVIITEFLLCPFESFNRHGWISVKHC